MSHSIKKLLRREGQPGVVKAKKAKQRAPTHPGARKLSFNAKRKMALAEGTAETEQQPTGTTARAEARKALGKQARLEQTARRRGIFPEAAAGLAAGAASSASVAATSDPSADRVASASSAAKRALACAPANQRAFQKELTTVLKASDVLLEVLDARDPMGCRCVALEDAVLAKCAGKRIVLVLNKVDLVPAAVTQRWLTYLRQYFPTLPFKAATHAKRDVGSSGQSGSVGKLSSYGTEAYGGDGLLQLLKNYSRSVGLKTAITVGIVGYPNVGKSSLINSLKRARAANVGATPGVTTVAQTIALDKKVKVMDCPGIIFARSATPEQQADVMLRNCVRVEQLDDPTLPVESILRRCPAEQLMEQYGVSRFDGALEFLTLLAAKRGHLRKGGAADHDAAARAVLHDWNSGAIRYHTEPPKSSGSVKLVERFADDFDWDGEVLPARADGDDGADSDDGDAGVTGDAPGPEQGGGGGVPGNAASDQMNDGGDAQLLQGWADAQSRSAPARKPPKKRSSTKRAMATAAWDDEQFNFQHNRGVRKSQQKDKKKKEKRAAAAAMLLG